jgi:hypothetical protein
MPTRDLQSIRDWLAAGRRSRPRVDIVYGRVLKLRPSERDRMLSELITLLGG